jgi:hypothetical protein
MARILTMHSRVTRFAALVLIGFAAVAHAAETPVISLAMRYTDARDRMIQTDFRPFRVIRPDSDLFKNNFATREDIGRQFPEAAKCAPKEASPCYFQFVRGPNEIVEITTVGAHADALIVRYVRVVTLKEANDLYGG